MCNAWNHPPDCTCGWGHAGSGSGSVYRAYGASSYSAPRFAPSNSVWRYRDDFCAPTTCPRCGKEVYFIRHNGGSVWVDSLGWPWPKHGCFESEGEGTSWASYFRENVPPETATHGVDVGVILHAYWAEEGSGKPVRILIGIEFSETRRVCLATSATNSTSYLRGRLAVLDLRNSVFYTSNCERRPILNVEVHPGELGLAEDWKPIRGTGAR